MTDRQKTLLSTAPFVQADLVSEQLPGVRLVIHKYDPSLETPEANQEALYRKIREINPDAILLKYPWYPTISRELFEPAPTNLKVVVTFAAGFDNVDAVAAREHGVHVSNCQHCVLQSTSEIAIWHIISCLRRFPYQIKRGIAGKWKDLTSFGREVHCRTLGIVGMGEIGFETARKAYVAFGMKILYTKRTRLDEEQEREVSATFYANLQEMLPLCDVVSLHVPLTDSTRHLFSTPQFELMKQTAYLINTSRGGVVDEEALLEALRTGLIAGAGLDVFVTEPCPGERMMELHDLGCSVTPHMGGHCTDVGRKLEVRCLLNLRNVLIEEREPEDLVN